MPAVVCPGCGSHNLEDQLTERGYVCESCGLQILIPIQPPPTSAVSPLAEQSIKLDEKNIASRALVPGTQEQTKPTHGRTVNIRRKPIRLRMVLSYFLLVMGLLLCIAGLSVHLYCQRLVSDAEERLAQAPSVITYQLPPDPRDRRGRPVTVTENFFERQHAEWEFRKTKEQAETYSFVCYQFLIAGVGVLVMAVLGFVLARRPRRKRKREPLGDQREARISSSLEH
jgi:DNA-directed RNA polymerase subunit RPC12/RpoP